MPAEIDRRAFLRRMGGMPAAPDGPLFARISGACLEARGTACRVCEGACEPAAFRFRPLPGGRAQVSVVEARCTGCGDCVPACPAGAIALAPADGLRQTEEAIA